MGTPQHNPHPKPRVNDLKLKHFKIRLIVKLCLLATCILQLISKMIGSFLEPTPTSTARILYYLGWSYSVIMPLIIIGEYLLFKKKGPGVVRYSEFVDVVLLLIFIADWITSTVINLMRVQGNPPCFRPGSLYGMTAFSWRALLCTLLVQKWQLKMIGPIAALAVTTGYVLHYATTGIAPLIIRGVFQFFYVIIIIYCEDKVKWKIVWTSFQQEQWMQVNNFILDTIPENVMVIDSKGEAKFISEYCKDFMKKCGFSLEAPELFRKIRDLQKQHESESPPENINQIDRLMSENDNELLGGLHRNNSDARLKHHIETLDDLIQDFRNLIKQNKLQERQFVVYNGKLKIEKLQDRSIEVKISFIQHYEKDFLIMILRDTTQRDLLVTLEETNKYKDQLLASVSHELRAPLNGNINLVESAVNSTTIPDDIKESLLVPALRSGKFLLHLINDILDMSQIKEKKVRLVFESGNLRDTLQSTAQLVELQAKKKGIELLVELDPHLPKNFVTDHVRLSQIALNLLSNAMKFTREGAIKLIATPMPNVPSWVKISVQDSGIGMSPEDTKKLFSNFTHIECQESQALNPAGVGLGLNIAYNLSQLLAPKNHGGIDVVSSLNEGSTFSFILENKQDPPLHLEELNLSNQKSFSHEIANESPRNFKQTLFYKKQQNNVSLSQMPLATRAFDSESLIGEVTCSCPRVLIVDDNPFNTMAFETILNSLEIKCKSVYSGSDAIKQLRKSRTESCGKNCKLYSVVFMDQEMPEMNGIEAVKEIRSLQEQQLISFRKVIGCTAHKSQETVDKFMKAGLDQCIHKPISKAMINDILKDVL